jgi:hypothetical protein
VPLEGLVGGLGLALLLLSLPLLGVAGFQVAAQVNLTRFPRDTWSSVLGWKNQEIGSPPKWDKP